MIPLNCEVKLYEWGKRGTSSEVARLKESSDDSYIICEGVPYAELWMGTHPSGPALLEGTDTFLLDWLKDKPETIGIVPNGYPTNDLPFMFKILSVKTALSIQAHPDKEYATILHAKFPDIYKDANHKPEMAIALTPFEALCGFRIVSEIKKNIEKYPELQAILGEAG